MVVRCKPLLAQQILKQVNKLPNTVEALDLTDANCVERELVLVRVQAPEGKRTTLLTETEIFRARVVTATPENYVFEVTGDSGKVEAFLDVVYTFDIQRYHPYPLLHLGRRGRIHYVFQSGAEKPGTVVCNYGACEQGRPVVGALIARPRDQRD